MMQSGMQLHKAEVEFPRVIAGAQQSFEFLKLLGSDAIIAQRQNERNCRGEIGRRIFRVFAAQKSPTASERLMHS